MRHKDPELMNRIKQYISEYYLENAGAMPTITEIANAMEIVRSTAYTYLVAMDRQGLIRYQDGKVSVRELDKMLSEKSTVVSPLWKKQTFFTGHHFQQPSLVKDPFIF